MKRLVLATMLAMPVLPAFASDDAIDFVKNSYLTDSGYKYNAKTIGDLIDNSSSCKSVDWEAKQDQRYGAYTTVTATCHHGAFTKEYFSSFERVKKIEPKYQKNSCNEILNEKKQEVFSLKREILRYEEQASGTNNVPEYIKEKLTTLKKKLQALEKTGNMADDLQNKEILASTIFEFRLLSSRGYKSENDHTVVLKKKIDSIGTRSVYKFGENGALLNDSSSDYVQQDLLMHNSLLLIRGHSLFNFTNSKIFKLMECKKILQEK